MATPTTTNNRARSSVAMQSTALVVAFLLVAASPVTALSDVVASSSVALVNGGSNASTTTAVTLCDSQLLFQKLYVLMPIINQCATECDYFVQPANISFPSDASLLKFCNSKNCTQMSVELDNAGLPSCSVPVGDTTMPFKVFFKDIKASCDNITSGNLPATASSGGLERQQMSSAAVAIAVIVVAALTLVVAL